MRVRIKNIEYGFHFLKTVSCFLVGMNLSRVIQLFVRMKSEIL